MTSEISTLYRFGEFEADPVNRVLTRCGKPVSIAPRALDLLLFLVRNPQRLLTKEELLKSVWEGVIVEEGNLSQNIFLLRKALSENGERDEPLIVTVSGRGYRFTPQVEAVISDPIPASLATVPGPLAISPEAPALPRRWPASSLWIAAGLGLAGIAALVLFLSGVPKKAPRPIPVPKPLTTNSVENPVITASLSPSGRYLAYSDHESLIIRTLQSAEIRSIPIEAGLVLLRVAWYPDETRLLVSERVHDSPRLMVFSILSGNPRLLRDDAINPAISTDGTRVLYAAPDIHELWMMDGNGENPRRILTVTAPDKVYPMFWSPDDKRVWFARVHWDKDKETVTLETCDLNGAHPTVVLSDNRVSAFRLLPGGRVVFARIEGPRNFTNLWSLAVDTVSGKPLGSPRRLTDWANFSISAISSTADGKRLAVMNGTWQAGVYVGDLRAGGTELTGTRRLTLDQSDNWPAFWTSDDQAVMVESNRNGRSEIFRQRLDRAMPDLLSTDAGEDASPKFGGRWIYFRSLPLGSRVAWDKPLGLRRLPAEGGASTEVLRDVGIDIDCAASHPEICVLVRLRGKTLGFRHFDHTRGEGAEIGSMEFDSRLFPVFQLSPDGSELAVLNPKGAGNRVRRISMKDGAWSEVEVPGRKELESLFWSPDGKGWYISSTTASNGEYLLHVSLKGESHVLFEQPDDGRDTWGIPSHDGKHLAFLEWKAPKNVWIIDGL